MAIICYHDVRGYIMDRNICGVSIDVLNFLSMD